MSANDDAIYTESECDIRENFDTNDYPNIFVSKKYPEPWSQWVILEGEAMLLSLLGLSSCLAYQVKVILLLSLI